MKDRFICVFLKNVLGTEHRVGAKEFDKQKMTVEYGKGKLKKSYQIDPGIPAYKAKPTLLLGNRYFFYVDIDTGQLSFNGVHNEGTNRLMSMIFNDEVIYQFARAVNKKKSLEFDSVIIPILAGGMCGVIGFVGGLWYAGVI